MDNEYFLYDLVLLNRKDTCGKELFETTINGRKEYNPIDEKRALKIIRHAFEYYLGWSPEQTFYNIDEEILQRLHLTGLVSQRIQFPAELDPLDNLQYLVCRIYPGRFQYRRRQAVEAYYEKVLSGELRRFKKGFFTSDDGQGKERAIICFQYMIQLAGHFTSIRQLYDTFYGTEGRQLLNRYKLSSACRDLFEFPLDFLHYSLSQAERDELYYQKLRFTLINEKQKREQRKKGIFIA